MIIELPLPISGYVLAGGKSSRMGRDKALLELAGKPLVEHAVIKLRRLCTDVKILSDNAQLSAYAPVVSDVHPGCGPLSGIEAALLETPHDWNLFLAVDLPFVSTRYLAQWVHSTFRPRNVIERALTFWKHEPLVDLRMAWVSDNANQLLVLLLHREIAPRITRALELQQYKLFETLRDIGEDLAKGRRLKPDAMIWNPQWDDWFGSEMDGATESWAKPTPPGWFAFPQPRFDMFANVNTPSDLTAAELYVDALDS